MTDKLLRISVAVDEETRSMLESLAKRENKTISEIIRQAIITYSKIEDKNLLVEAIDKYLDVVSKSDNIIIDIELWLTILDELNRHSSEEFWELIEKIGYEHGLELKSRGVTSIEEILNLFEFRHLFEVKKNDSKDGYVLILATRNEVKLLKAYLCGLFKSLGIEDIEIVEGLRKLIILKKESKKLEV
jgi:predicted DNA-binding protein